MTAPETAPQTAPPQRQFLEAWLRGEHELAGVARLLGIKPTEVADGTVSASMTVTPDHHNAFGTLHGGLVCAFADVVMGAALATVLGAAEGFVTLEQHMNHISAARDGSVTATARVVHRGRSVAHLECDIRFGDGRPLGRASCVCLLSGGASQAATLEPAAFYEPDGDLLVATSLTSGPWDANIQAGGPPAALLARALAAAPGGEGRRIARITCELLGPVPLTPLRTVTAEVRRGRSVDLVDASLQTRDGAVVMIARAWRLPDQSVELPARARSADPPPALPEQGKEVPFFPIAHQVGYHTAMEWSFVHGSFLDPGPAFAWLRMRVPLVAGEAPSPVARVLVAADSTSGVSAALDPARYQFRNVDLTVHLHRDPDGEWIGLDARSIFTGTRSGLARSSLHDRAHLVGYATQTLLVSEGK